MFFGWMRRVCLIVLVGWLVVGVVAPPQSFAQDVEGVPHVRLPPLSQNDRAALQHDAPDGPQAFATAREVNEPLADLLAWKDHGSSYRIGRGYVTSPGAETLNLGFRDLVLPPGARLTVSRPDGTHERGPYTGDVASGALFTPVIASETVLITIIVPADAGQPTGRLVHVGHGWQPPEQALDPLRPRASGACNIDTACADADDWGEAVSAVGRITYVRNGSQFSCSGALINTTEGPIASYFLTAQHCVDAQEQADTAVFYWNYEHPNCRTPGSTESGQTSPEDPFEDTSTGATLRASIGTGAITGGPDITLLEVEEPLSPAFNLHFNGWTREDTAPDASATIHHPGGFAKRISFDDDPATITSYASDNEGDATHLRIADWDDGTTEPGSSGGPLLDSAQRIAGVLSGGLAACGRNEPDWYGRLAMAWEGPASSQRLRDWLDPAGTGATTTDRAEQGGHIDPPPPVESLTVSEMGNRSALVAWNAPSYTSSAPVQRYRVRVDTSPIENADDFAGARSLATPPPVDAGEAQDLRIDNLWPETPYYVTIQTENAAGWSSLTPLDAPLELPDRIAPASINDFRIAELNPASVALTWTATGDDEMRGTASTYDLRYAERPIETTDDFARATPVDVSKTPDTVGTLERVTLTDVPRNTPLYFGLVAIDNAGNESPVARTTRNATLIDDAQQIEGPMPNPATASSVLQVTVREAQTLRIRLYDTLGRAVGQPLNAEVPALEAQRVPLPIETLASGTYFVQIQGVDFSTTKRLVVVR